MRLIKDRDRQLNLSQSTSFFPTLLILLLAILIVGVCFTLIQGIVVLQGVMGLSLFVFAFYFIKKNNSNTILIPHPHIYEPSKKLEARGLNLVFLFFSMMVLSGLLIYGGASGILPSSIFGFGVLLITVLLTSVELKKIFELHEKIQKFGRSEIKILNNNTPKLGELLKIQFENPFLNQNFGEVEVTLRNIHERKAEKVSFEKKANRSIYYLHEEKQKHLVFNGVLFLDFQLPFEGAKPTELTNEAPYYWELEVSHKINNFYSRFFIDIHEKEKVESLANSLELTSTSYAID